jgi:hypothetical protein
MSLKALLELIPDLEADPRLMARRSAVNVFLLRIGRDPAPQA